MKTFDQVRMENTYILSKAFNEYNSFRSSNLSTAWTYYLFCDVETFSMLQMDPSIVSEGSVFMFNMRFNSLAVGYANIKFISHASFKEGVYNTLIGAIQGRYHQEEIQLG
jgi:hypothetical protein